MQVDQEFCGKFVIKLRVGDDDVHPQATKYNNIKGQVPFP